MSKAILYDFMQVKGGAESVTLDVCRHIDNLDLVTAFVNSDAFSGFPCVSGKVHALLPYTAKAGWQSIQAIRAFQNKAKFLKQYQTLLFSGIYAPLSIKYSEAKKNYYYCHTPPRFVYDLKDYYLDTVPLWQKPMLKGLISYLQPRYEDAIGKMDKVFANSKNVQGRLRKYLGVDSEVLYPPCNIDRFKFIEFGDYFLSTARLEPYKRVDLIVKAFMQMPDKKLVVTSGGSQVAYLRELAKGHQNITFTGWVTEKELADLVGRCLATIYIPMDEDFGMSPVESMGAGKPVIGVNEGGVKETVIDGKSGFLLDKEISSQELTNCILNLCLEDLFAMKEECVNQAFKFRELKFRSFISKYI